VRVHGPTTGLAVQFAVLAILATGVGLGLRGWLAATAYALVTWVLLSRALYRSGRSSLGAANAVTLARATLVGGVTALVADFSGDRRKVAVLVALAAVALLLDAVDGHVARRTGTSSPLGARFDMEIDAFLILVLSVFVARSLGSWVLAIGALRYVFVVAALGLPWLSAPLPPRLSRKTVAALQGIVLVVVCSGAVPGPLTTPVVGLALALLGWSFVRDIGWLRRARTRTGDGLDPADPRTTARAAAAARPYPGGVPPATPVPAVGRAAGRGKPTHDGPADMRRLSRHDGSATAWSETAVQVTVSCSWS
jgi:phosphatidylglycerophosphate synthase